MRHTPSKADDKNHRHSFDGASVTLRGSVEKIVSSSANNSSEAVEIVIEGAESLYREIRIQNLLQHADGRVVALEPGSEVQITIKVRTGK